MKARRGKRSISGPAALVLLGVFAAGILSVLLTGAKVYKDLTERDALSGDSRTCAQYLTGKVRQAPAPDAVVLSDFGEGSALLIAEEIGGQEYHTQIYLCDGWIMELFAAANAGLAPEDGEKILPAQSLTIEREGALLRFDITDGAGAESSVLVSLRGGEGGAHAE